MMNRLFFILFICLAGGLSAQTYLPFNHEGKWGVITSTGEVAVPPQFSRVGTFNEGFAVAKLNGYATLIDSTGSKSFPFRYFEIKPLAHDLGKPLWMARDINGFRIIDKAGEELSPAHFKSLKVVDEFYIGEREAGIGFGKIGNTSFFSRLFDQVDYDNYTFFCEDNGEQIIYNDRFEVVLKGKIRSVKRMSNTFIVYAKGKKALYSYQGKLILSNIKEEQLLKQQILGYDPVKASYFLYSEQKESFVYLENEIYIGRYLDYAILSAQGYVVLIAPDGERNVYKGYDRIDHQFGFLLMATDSGGFDVFNPRLEKIVENTDLIRQEDRFFLFRRDDKYGLFTEEGILVEPKYNFFDIREEEIKAYPDEGLLLIKLNNDNPIERRFYPNFISLKSYGDIPSMQLDNQTQNNRWDTGQPTDISNLWTPDTVFYEGGDNQQVFWGLKKDTFVVAPRYREYKLLTDRVSLGYYYSNRNNIRVFGNVPTTAMFDLIDHQNGVKLNDRPYHSFEELFEENKVWVVRNRKDISILGPDLNVLHQNIAYVNKSRGDSIAPFCADPDDLVFGRQQSADKYAFRIGRWLSFLGDNRPYPDTDDDKYDYIEMVHFKNAGWGYMNDSAQIIFDATFDYAFPFQMGVGIYEKDNKYGAVNSRKKIIPPIYDRLNLFRLDGDPYVRAVRAPASKAIYIDSLGNAKNAEYRALLNSWRNNNEKLITVTDGVSYGMIDHTGEIVIPVHLTMEPIVKEDYIISRTPKCGIHGFNGEELVAHRYRRIESFKNDRVVFRERNKLGVGNSSGEVLIPADYDFIELGEESIYCARNSSSQVFDYEGELISNDNWDYSYYNENKDAWVYRRGGRTTIKLADQTLRLEDLNRSIRFLGDYLLVESSSGEFNLHHLNEELTPVFNESYDRIEIYNDSIFFVYNRSRFGMRTIDDKEILPIRYRSLVEIFEDTLAGIYGGHLRVYDLHGNVLFERDAEAVYESDNDCFLVKGRDGATYYDRRMKNKFYSTYENATSFKNGYASVQKEKFWTVINKYGDEMFQPCYGSVVPLGTNMFFAKDRYLMGIFDTDGNEILPVKYDEIVSISNELLQVVDNGNIGYYHIDGYWLIEPGEEPSGLTVENQ